MATIELQIAGKVQGVFFRAATQEKAAALGITGWVRNLPDGSVEVRASGSTDALSAFEAWCRTGPPRARVASVERRVVPDETFDGFRIIH